MGSETLLRRLSSFYIEKKIANSRRKLMNLWDDRGATDPEILALSIELDNLMNLIQRFKNKP